MVQRRGSGAGELEGASGKRFCRELYREELQDSNLGSKSTSNLIGNRSGNFRTGEFWVVWFLRVGGVAAGAGEPFGLAGIPVIDGVEDQFHARGDAEFLEDAEQVFLDSVLTEFELAGNLTVAVSLGDEGDNLFFARSEYGSAFGVDHAQRWHGGDQIEDAVELFGVGPDLSGGHAEQTFVEQAEVGVTDG